MSEFISNTVFSSLEQLLAAKGVTVAPALNSKLQDDLLIDSLALATLVMDISQLIEFDLDVFTQSFGELHTVSDLVNLIGNSSLEQV
ncbi:MAG: hypothetical protein OEZ47_10080 [Gammaproteobacteria bacterium]|nr:hypothetical protein [Gammaproteobacteria bacterium]